MHTETMSTEKEKVVEVAESFVLLLNNPELTEMDIDAAIEELRPLRMKMHALEYGSAPGFRKYDIKRNAKDPCSPTPNAADPPVAEGERGALS